MAWPSGTKASTDNCDQPSDLIANARADIKQNIDNVNDVIDTFNIASPSDGDLLQYSSSTGKFEPVDVSNLTGFVSIVSFGENIISTSSTINTVTPLIATTVLKTPANNLVSVVENDSAGLAGLIQLEPGTYFIESNESPNRAYPSSKLLGEIALWDHQRNEFVLAAEANGSATGGYMQAIAGIVEVPSTTTLELYGKTAAGTSGGFDSRVEYSTYVGLELDSAGDATVANSGLGFYLKITKIA